MFPAPSRSRATRKGFTLVEMLIVVAIVGILTAIAVPVFSRVRENARRSSCQSNLKQLGLAFTQYAQDNGRKYPAAGTFYASGFAGFSQPWTTGRGHWVAGTTQLDNPSPPYAWTGTTAKPEEGALFSYVKEISLFYCPSNKTGQSKKLSYSMNCALNGINDVRIKTPTEIVLLVDEENTNDGYFYAVHDPGGGSPSPKSGASTSSGSQDALTARHNGSGNLLFADGHVKPYQMNAFVLDGTPDGLENKWRDTGVPRFHDKAFGPYGSAKNPTSGITQDYCNADKRVP